MRHHEESTWLNANSFITAPPWPTRIPSSRSKRSVRSMRAVPGALTNAAITGPETVGDRLRYSFERAIGSKG